MTTVISELIQAFSDDVIRICYEPLDVDEALRLINSPSCGATSVFVGTTRDTFAGRKVTRLDYESYDEMAYKELRRLCSTIRDKFPSVERVVILHRIGEVAVGETSVVIATASPHRKDAIHATEMAIDELKRAVPIWKKEVYEDGGCSWKENGE
ncbi:molybdopterin converting factor, subunit 2, partial [Ancylostoma duodenale]